MQTLYAISPTTVVDTALLSEALAILIRKHMQDLMVVNAQGQFIGTINSLMFSKLLLPPEPQLPDDAGKETAEDVDNRLFPLCIARWVILLSITRQLILRRHCLTR